MRKTHAKISFAALLVLAGLGRTAQLPAAIGQPFRRD